MKKKITIRVATIVAMVLSLLGIAAVFYLGASTGNINIAQTNIVSAPPDRPTPNATQAQSQPQPQTQSQSQTQTQNSQPPSKPGSRMYGAENPNAKGSSRPGRDGDQTAPDDRDDFNNFDDLGEFFDFDDRHASLSRTTSTPLTIAIYAFLFAVFSLIFWLSLTLFIASFLRPASHPACKHLWLWLFINLILVASATAILTAAMLRVNTTVQPEFSEETTKVEVSLDESTTIAPGTTDLSTKDSDLTITQSGTYTLTGHLSRSVIIDAPGADVNLILDNAEITATDTAAIVGLAAEQLTITLADGSSNTVSDGGSSEYDGAIFSNANLVFEGTGKLTVNGQQNDGEGIASESHDITFFGGTYIITASDDGINAGGDGGTLTFNDGNFYINASGDGIDSNQGAVINDGTIFVIGSDTGGNAGIDTETGYTINGGTLVALGSDMVEAPQSTSKQASMVFTLGSTLAAETPVALKKAGDLLISFTAPKSFRTMIISTPKLENGDYQVFTGGTDSGTLKNDLTAGIYQGGTYTGGTPLSVSGSETFTVSTIVNTFGTSRH